MALTPEQTAQLAAQWGMPADQFLAAIQPYMNGGNSWSDPNGAGPQLQLANGKTWQPSGASSGITYTPKGTMVETSPGTWGQGEEASMYTAGPSAASTADQWTVSGDMSAMLGQPGSNKHTSVTYENVNGVMTPVSAPADWDWKSPYSSLMPVVAIAALALTGGAIAAWAEAAGAMSLSAGVAGSDLAAIGGALDATAATAEIAGTALSSGATLGETIAMMEANGLTMAEISTATGGMVEGFTAADVAAAAASTGTAGLEGAAINEAVAGATGNAGEIATKAALDGTNAFGANSAANAFNLADAGLGTGLYAGSVPTSVNLGLEGAEAISTGLDITGAKAGGEVLGKAALDGTNSFGANNATGVTGEALTPYSGSTPTSVDLLNNGGTVKTGLDTAGNPITTPGVKAPTTPKAPVVPGAKTPTMLDKVLDGTSNAQLLATLASLYSGKDVAKSIGEASDKLQQGITNSKGQLLTSKTEALKALSDGLIDQKTAISAGLIDANGALTKGSKDAVAAIQGGYKLAQGNLHDQLDPYTQAGQKALAQLSAGTAPGGEFNKTFTMDDAQNSAAMQNAQAQGMDIIQNSAAGRSGILGTNQQADLVKFGQGNAAQYQNQAFNQWLANRNANQTGVQNLANTGLTAGTTLGTGLANLSTGAARDLANIDTGLAQHLSANDMAAAGRTTDAIGGNATNVANIATGYGNNVSNLDMTGAQINANSILGQSRAMQDGVSNAIKAYGTLGGGGGGGGGGSTVGDTVRSIGDMLTGTGTGTVTDLTGVSSDAIIPPVDDTAIDLFSGGTGADFGLI